jgi:hypothetical protein
MLQPLPTAWHVILLLQTSIDLINSPPPRLCQVAQGGFLNIKDLMIQDLMTSMWGFTLSPFSYPLVSE